MAHASEARAQDVHSHDFVHQIVEEDHEILGQGTLLTRIDCPEGYTAIVGAYVSTDPSSLDSLDSLLEGWRALDLEGEVLGKDFYFIVLHNPTEKVFSVTVHVYCQERATEPASDEEGSEHFHKLAKSKIANKKVTLDPDGGKTLAMVECPKGVALGAAVTVPDGYRKFAEEIGDKYGFFGFVGEPGSRLESDARADRAKISQSCHKLTTKRANGHNHDLDVQVVTKKLRVPARTEARDAPSEDEVQEKTLRCPKGYLALSPGYSSGLNSTFRFLGAKRTGRRMKFFFLLPEPDLVFLSVACLAETVS